MAKVVIIGGGFAGIVAAESLARELGPNHQIKLVSRSQDFTFYPALVRLAFGQCKLEDIFFDLRGAMLDRRIEFVQAEVAYPDTVERCVVIHRGKREIKMPYDYLVFALGRRLTMESIRGFHDHAHHLLTTGAALKFGEAVKSFHDGHAVIGYCRDSRLAVPVYETAFALDRLLRSRGERDRVKITIVSPEELGGQMGGKSVAPALQAALGEHGIEFVPDFPIDLVTSKEVWSQTNQNISYDLLMLLPPFDGPGEAAYTGLTDVNNYVRVDRHMRVTGQDGVYAAGDCLNLLGPKMGHMAVLQGEVAAANLAAEIEGRDPVARYNHEIVMVVDTGDQHSLYVHKKLWERSEPAVRQGRFWGWAKQAHKRYWQQIHS